MRKEIEQILLEFPNLKAKEIAKRTGFDRSAVSSFLHNHTDRYEQNANYQWKIKTGVKRTISLYAEWMTSEELENVLTAAGDLFGEVSEVEFIFPYGCKLMIDTSARLLALSNQLVRSGKRVKVDVTQATDVKGYLNRTGFFDLLDSRVVVVPQKPINSTAKRYRGNSGTLVEFGPVNPDGNNADLVEQLTNTFVNQSSNEYQMAALTVFGELIGNISEHSCSPIPGFAGLQKYGGRQPHIQMIVSDSGIGIAGTLRPILEIHHPELHSKFSASSIANDAGLVEEVLRAGEISRFGKGDEVGRGLGLKSSQNQAAKFNVMFTVRQERFAIRAKFRNGEMANIQTNLNLLPLQGTHICFDFIL